MEQKLSLSKILNSRTLKGLFFLKNSKQTLNFRIKFSVDESNPKHLRVREAHLKLFRECHLVFKMRVQNLNLIRRILIVAKLKSKRLQNIEYRQIFNSILDLALPFESFVKDHRNLFLSCPKKEQSVFISFLSSKSPQNLNNYLHSAEFSNRDFIIENLSKNGFM